MQKNKSDSISSKTTHTANNIKTNIVSSSPNNSALEELRKWYYRRSREFTSSNYPKYLEEKKLSAEIEEGYHRFERLLEIEKIKLHKEFEKKLNIARTIPTPKSSILVRFYSTNDSEIQFVQQNDYMTLGTTAFHSSSPEIASLMKKNSHIPKMPQLRPEDFCDLSENDENTDESESEHCTEKAKAVKGEELCNTSLFTVPFNSHSAKEKGTINESNLRFPTTEETGSNFHTSTPVKNTKKSNGSMNLGSESIFLKWLQHYSSFGNELLKEIKNFEQDSTQKELRIQISRTIANRINDCSKKNSSRQEFAILVNFLTDLFECKIVDGWQEGSKFSLEHGERIQQMFAMSLICTRYLEQIKWDQGLMDHIRLVLVFLCTKVLNFYEIFCAKIVDALVLLSMDENKVISKIISSGKETSQDTITQWISNEQTLFRLFCKVQCALKSNQLDDLGGSNPDRIRGITLIKMIYTSVVESQKPTILCNYFILSETLQFSRQLIKRNNKFEEEFSNHFMPLIRKLMERRWDEMVSNENLKRLDDCASAALSSRHDYLLCLLGEKLDKLEE